MVFDTPCLTHGSTEQVAPGERLSYWDNYNASALIGLRTASYAGSGLIASQTNATLRHTRIAEIRGNEHVVERSPFLVKNHPKQSVFACHLIKGRAIFVQGDITHVLNPLDTIIYDTSKPFTLDFPVEMHELLIDVPTKDLYAYWGIQPHELPLKISPTMNVSAAISAELRRSIRGYLQDPTPDASVSLPTRTHTLLRSMVQSQTSGGPAMQQSVFHILKAKTYIAQHLGDMELSPMNVACNVGVSVRHLNRLFTNEDCSISRYIWAQRTAMAYLDLLNCSRTRVTISEIAFRWGFSSQAHFCRAIRARYGNTPSDIAKAQPTY